MTIETKFEIGQKAYFTLASIIYEGKIISVEAFISEDETQNKIRYGVEYTSANYDDHKERTNALWIYEDELFFSFSACFNDMVRRYEEKLKSDYEKHISK